VLAFTLTTTAAERNRFTANRDRCGDVWQHQDPEADYDGKDQEQAKGITPIMSMPSAVPRGRTAPRQVLFTPPARLGWTFRSRRDLITPYPEPPPDQEAIRRQAAARLAAAQVSWQRARKWGIRPSLIIIIGLTALAGCAHAVSGGSAPFGTTILTGLILGSPGLGWSGWRYAQLSTAKAADPEQQYQQAHQEWAARAAEYEQAEMDSLAEVPQWGSADLPAPRTDVYGGTLAGWSSLLTVHGASILARQPLLVADLSGQYALAGLAALTREARVPAQEYLFPRDLDRFGLLVRLAPQQLADALAEAIHAGSPSTARTERAVDFRVLGQIFSAIADGGITPARMAAATQLALGRPVPPGLLSTEEEDMIGGKLFGENYHTQIGTNLVRLDAFLADLASYDSGTGPLAAPPPPAWCTFLAMEPAARSARAELIAALVIQWLTVQVTASPANTPAVIIAAADEITRPHLERLADACDRRHVPLTLLFRHLRDDATALIGGGSTAFMRLGNHHEAEQAAAFIGRHHKFVLSGFTATSGAEHTSTRGQSENWGSSESRGFSSTRGWTEDLLSHSSSGSRTRSRDYAKTRGWGTEYSESDGTSWSDAETMQRVYEYTVEPTVLQDLPDNALLLIRRGSTGSQLQPVECDPALLTLPDVTLTPLDHQPAAVRPAPAQPAAQPGWPQIAPRQYQPRWLQPPDSQPQPARPPRRQPPRPLWHDMPPDPDA
jgi:hypothetical protein